LGEDGHLTLFINTQGCPNTDYFSISREPGSSVSMVSGYGLDDRAIEVRSLAEAKGIFL
jgi:hypothetical protein